MTDANELIPDPHAFINATRGAAVSRAIMDSGKPMQYHNYRSVVELAIVLAESTLGEVPLSEPIKLSDERIKHIEALCDLGEEALGDNGIDMLTMADSIERVYVRPGEQQGVVHTMSLAEAAGKARSSLNKAMVTAGEVSQVMAAEGYNPRPQPIVIFYAVANNQEFYETAARRMLDTYRHMKEEAYGAMLLQDTSALVSPLPEDMSAQSLPQPLPSRFESRGR